MPHLLCQVAHYAIISDYTIHIGFDDGSEQTIDFRPVLYGEVFGPLRDLALFNQVSLDPIVHTLTWPNGADFDPETLRNWPDYIEELSSRARRWKAVQAQ